MFTWTRFMLRDRLPALTTPFPYPTTLIPTPAAKCWLEFWLLQFKKIHLLNCIQRRRIRIVKRQKIITKEACLKNCLHYIDIFFGYLRTLEIIPCGINSQVSVQWFSHVQLFVTPWTAAHQASLSITNSRSLLKFMSIKLVMPSKHLILCRSLLLLFSIFPSIKVFSNESALRISWPKYWSFSFSISPSNKYSGLISFGMDWMDLLAVQGTVLGLWL